MKAPFQLAFGFALIAMTAQPAIAEVICEGSYEFFSGKSTIKALPGQAPENGEEAARRYNNRTGWVGQIIRKPQSEGLHQVEVSQCGRQFVLSQGSNKMLFLQSIMDDTLYVAQDIGTAEAELTLRVTDHKIMLGTIAGESHGFSFDYPVAMEPRDISMPDMTGCTDDAAPKEEKTDDDRLTIDPELRREAINIVADELGIPRDKSDTYISAARTVAKTRSSDKEPTVILPGEGNCPIEFEGFRTCREFPSDITTIVETNVLMDEDGRLLPVTTEGSASGRVRVDNPAAANVCSLEPASLPVADRRLRFKFFAIEEDGINDVQTMLVDAETNHAKAAHYAKGQNKGKRGRTEAASEAYEAIGAPVTGVK